MAIQENKSASSQQQQQSNLRDASSESSSSSVSSKFSTSALRETADRFVNEASPRVRDAYGQLSDVASDFYGRANTWLSQGNNRNYGMIALVATVGVLGFALGRTLSSKSET